jgi:hypothetical protein
MTDKPGDALHEYRQHLEDWLTRFEKAKEVEPLVRQAIELKRWEDEVYRTAPEAARDGAWDYTFQAYTTILEDLRSTLPEMPDYNPANVRATTVSGSASGTIVYNYVRSTGDICDLETQIWSKRYVTAYHTIQNTFHRAATVGLLLGKLHPNLAAEFNEVEADVLYTTMASEGVAIRMRNVLDHYKGELFNLALRPPREQKCTWQIMADRLCISPVGSPPHQQLSAQEDQWKQLKQRLSDAAKNTGWKNNAYVDMTAIRTTYLDHLYTVLSLVRLDETLTSGTVDLYIA